MAKVSKQSKRRLIILGPISIIAIAYFLFTFVSYAISISTLKIEEKRLNEQLISLQEEKANLKIEIVKLNDPEYVARYAKENYLYSSDGEYVIKIDNDEAKENKDNNNNNFVKYILISIGVVFIISLVVKNKKNS